jgi:hypothetical protein
MFISRGATEFRWVFWKNSVMVSELSYMDGVGGNFANDSVLVIDTTRPVSWKCMWSVDLSIPKFWPNHGINADWGFADALPQKVYLPTIGGSSKGGRGRVFKLGAYSTAMRLKHNCLDPDGPPAPLPARRAYRPEGRAYASESDQSSFTWSIKSLRSVSLWNIFLLSMPRPITWCNTPGASNLANLGITCTCHIEH